MSIVSRYLTTELLRLFEYLNIVPVFLVDIKKENLERFAKQSEVRYQNNGKTSVQVFCKCHNAPRKALRRPFLFGQRVRTGHNRAATGKNERGVSEAHGD